MPRQCSAVNMTGRVAAAQIKTMAAEVSVCPGGACEMVTSWRLLFEYVAAAHEAI